MNETPAAIPEIKYPTPPSRNWWRVLYNVLRVFVALTIANLAGWPMSYLLIHNEQEAKSSPLPALAWLLGGALCLFLSFAVGTLTFLAGGWLVFEAGPRWWARLKRKAGVE